MSFDAVPWLYLAALVFSLAGLGLLDWRHKLAFALSRRATLITIGIGVGFFLLWDFAGIFLGIFFRGDALHLTGILIAPELPIEEIFFLILLCYSTLIVHSALAKLRLRK